MSYSDGKRKGSAVNKLFKLKKWLTVPEAARHLTIVFGEEVRESDVLRLALDGHLKLSVNLLNHAKARRGKVIPLSEARTAPSLFQEGDKPRKVVRAIPLNEHDFLELDEQIVTLDGVWDLPFIGNEGLDVEQECQQLNDGPTVTLQSLDGAFVKGQDGQLFQLQEDFDDNRHTAGSKAGLRELEERIALENIEPSKARELLDRHKERRKKYLAERKANRDAGRNSANYFPAGRLPHDSVLVVRSEALWELEESMNEAPSSAERSLTTTERNTLLVIIAALCNYSAIKPQERGAATQIAKLTEEIGATVTDDTVRTALAKIPDALETRRK